MRAGARWLLALAFAVAGYFHLVHPEPFLRIVPALVPNPEAVVFWTGIAELLGAAALAQVWSRRLRHAGAVALALYSLCVWPANVNHFALDMARADEGWGLGYHVPRLLAQPLVIWLALWTGGVIDWPWRRRPDQGSLPATP